MIWFHGNIGAFGSALQETPEIFQTVSVNLAINVTLCMIDNLMDVLFVQAPIRMAIIGRQVRTRFNIFLHHGVKGVFLTIWNYLSPHFASTTLKESGNDGLISCAFSHSRRSHFGAFVFVHESGLAADEGFIYFNVASASTKLYEGTALDCKPDAMQHEPSGFLSDAQSAMNFIRANAILAANEEPNCGKPFLKRNRRIFKDGSDFERKLLLCMIAIAAIHTRFLKVADFFRAAIRAAYFAVWPANRDHERTAVFVIAEVANGFK